MKRTNVTNSLTGMAFMMSIVALLIGTGQPSFGYDHEYHGEYEHDAYYHHDNHSHHGYGYPAYYHHEYNNHGYRGYAPYPRYGYSSNSQGIGAAAGAMIGGLVAQHHGHGYEY